ATPSLGLRVKRGAPANTRRLPPLPIIQTPQPLLSEGRAAASRIANFSPTASPPTLRPARLLRRFPPAAVFLQAPIAQPVARSLPAPSECRSRACVGRRRRPSRHTILYTPAAAPAD